MYNLIFYIEEVEKLKRNEGSLNKILIAIQDNGLRNSAKFGLLDKNLKESLTSYYISITQ